MTRLAGHLDAIVASARRYRTDMDFDTLGELMKRHGLHFPES